MFSHFTEEVPDPDCCHMHWYVHEHIHLINLKIKYSKCYVHEHICSYIYIHIYSYIFIYIYSYIIYDNVIWFDMMWYDMIMWYVDGDNNAKGQLGIRERFLWTDQILASIKNPTSKCGTWTLHSFSPTLLGFLINLLTVLKILIAHHERPGPILNKLLT